MAENSTTVVQLNSHLNRQGDDVDSHLFARMPAPFVAMKDKGKHALQPLLQALFDNIDDALFELADRAEHNAEQNMYFESMREIRIKRRGMELGFGREIDSAFRLLLTADETIPTLGAADEIDVDSLSLVDHDELEELVAVDNMVLKTERQFGQLLKSLTTRLDTLIEGQAVTGKNNPFGPSVVCHAFNTVCKSLDLDIKARLVLFKLFDRYVMAALDQVLEACNEQLVSGGILPRLGQSRAAKRQATATATAASQSEQASVDVFASLQGLLHRIPQTNTVAHSGLVAPGQAPQIPRDTLMQLLQAVQQSLMSQMAQQQQAAMQGIVPQQLDVQQSLSSLLSAKIPSKPMSIGQVDDDAMNLVAMLFQFILDDRNLATPMKALIARLQIPIIKVAMLDKSFFSRGGHPARKLLNEIANASLGWAPGNNLERDPLYKKVSSVVNRLLSEVDTDTELFQEVLADFVAFQEMDKRRIDLIAQRTINAEDGKAKSELARSKVQTALNEKVAGKTLPKVVITLLEQAWSNVLFLIFLKEGEEGKSWNDALQVVDDLLWSVQLMETNESRQRLLTIVPKLLKNLRAGLTKIGFNPFEMNQLFTDLEAIHMGQLQQLNTVKLDVSTTEAKAEQLKSRQAIMGKTRVIEKTLDQMLEDRSSGNDVSLETLDAELDQQLAQFDALGDLVARSAEEKSETKIEASAAAESAASNDRLARQVVEKLVVSGASEETAPTVVELAEDDPSVQKVDSLSMGNWVELHQEDGKKFRCRLAAIIRSTGKYIFVNRSGMKVAEYQRMSLAQAIKQGRVSTLDEGLLFDRALQSVIGNLRNMKSSGA